MKTKIVLHSCLLWYCLQTSYGISVDTYQVDKENVYINKPVLFSHKKWNYLICSQNDGTEDDLVKPIETQVGTACRSKLNKQTKKQHQSRQITWKEEGCNGWLDMSEYIWKCHNETCYFVKWIYTNKKFKAVMTYGFMYTYYHGINDQVDMRFCVFSKLLFSQELFIRSPWFLMCTQRWDHYSENAPFNAIISPSCRTSIWLFLCAFQTSLCHI